LTGGSGRASCRLFSLVARPPREVMMNKLHLGIEIRDFDLERLGFSLSVLDQTNERQTSEGYLRMTLAEMNAFLWALKAAGQTVEVSTFEPTAIKRPLSPARLPPASGLAPSKQDAQAYSLRHQEPAYHRHGEDDGAKTPPR
jgi:hypothetical protein